MFHRNPGNRFAPLIGVALPCLAFAFLSTVRGPALSVAEDTAPAPQKPAPEEPAPKSPAPDAPAPQTPAVPAAPSAPASADAPPAPAPDAGAPVARGLGKGFESPDAAAKALFDALEKNDEAELRAIAGPGNEDIIPNAKDQSVRAERAQLVAAAKAKLSTEKQADGRMVVVVGRMEYPLAIPLVSKDGAWHFDAPAGRQELLARRIGENELEAVGICLAYADAQVEYASKDRNGDGVKEYAQRLGSTPGQKDGLYWESATDDDPSPAGPGLTPFKDALKADAPPQAPFNGYYWRILTAQGPQAPGGAYSYVINGRMIAGFALLAVPATHRNTGVMSFIVSNQGKIYEKDLGPDTLKAAAAIDTFDPDSSWREVDDTTLRTAAQSDPEDAPFAEKGSELPASGDSMPGAPSGSGAPAGTPCPTKG